MAVVALAGCGGSGGGLGRTTAATPKPTTKATATAAKTAKPHHHAPVPHVGPAPIPARFRRAAARLPLTQRIGQLMVVAFTGTDLQAPVFAELEGHGWGGIIVGPDNAPAGEAGVGVFAGEAKVDAENAKRVVPLVAAVDDGRPSHLGSSPAAGRRAANAAAVAAKAQGITLTTAPAIDVGFGADADLITRVAPAAIRGWLRGGVAPAPGHFPGQGAVTQDPLDGPANVGTSAGDLAGRDLRPFQSALKRAPAVTVSSASFTAYDAVTPAALTPVVVKSLLRGGLRYGGVAMSDDLEGLAVATGSTQATAGVRAIQAGVDLLYVPDPGQRNRVYTALLRAAKAHRIPRSRVLTAVARVLELKARVR